MKEMLMFELKLDVAHCGHSINFNRKPFLSHMHVCIHHGADHITYCFYLCQDWCYLTLNGNICFSPEHML